MGLLGLVLPSRCAVCARPGPALCGRCDAGLIRLCPPVCDRCGCPGAWPVRRCVECARRRLAFARARSALVYDARARLLVSAWKERGRRDLARSLATIVVEVLARPAVDEITFVPGDRERGRARGHVPAEGLARALAECWSLPVAAPLARTGTGPWLAGVPRALRAANVRGAFVARGPVGRNVLLVDDVYTTGATVSACATELRRAGARLVEVVCLARAVR
jgi:predicted amidophosphoribosyltransferase